MKLSRLIVRRTLAIVILAELALCTGLIVCFALRRPAHSGSAPLIVDTTTLRRQTAVASSQKAVIGSPLRLQIPKIAVDTALDYVGLTSKGALDVPKGPAKAAWFNLGPRPGEVGAAVIDGHFGYKDHIPAVFDNLHALQEGDNLYIGDDRGATTTFVVRELRTYGPNDDATGVFRSSDGKIHLNLITCQGDWHEAQRSFSSRLVVFADKVL